MRKPQEKTFKKEVDDVGVFVFKYLTIREDMMVENETAKLLDYNPTPNDIAYYKAKVIATLNVAIEIAPKGWSLDDCYDFDDLVPVFAAYTAEVNFFRSKGVREDQDQGVGDSPESEVLVSTKVSAPRNRPAHSRSD
jgi:hypothetical protein